MTKYGKNGYWAPDPDHLCEMKFNLISQNQSNHNFPTRPQSSLANVRYLRYNEICEFRLKLPNMVICPKFPTEGHIVFVRSSNKTQSQLEENDDNDTDDTTDDFIVAGMTCAIAAGSGHELLWFVHIDIVDNAPYVSGDHTIHTILPAQTYITGHYLEKKKEKKDGKYYHISKNQVFIAKESVVYPFVNFKHEHKGKSGELFFSNEDYTEILNFVEHTNMAMF